MAKSILFNIVAEFLTRIGSHVVREVSSLWNLESDLESLAGTLSTIQAILLDAKKKEAQDYQLHDWLGKLKDVILDTKDVLEEFEFQAPMKVVVRQKRSTLRKVSQCFSSSNPVGFRYEISEKIKQIKKRLDQIIGDRSRFSLIKSILAEVRHVIPKERETGPLLGVPFIIGREHDKEKIISFLIQQTDNDVSIIPIVGIGFGLMKEIINSAIDEDCIRLKGDEIPKHLQEILTSKRFLLVLDDVWNKRLMKWLELKDLLLNGVNGSKIIVSTRSNKVVEIMSISPLHFMQGLSNEESLSLFKKYAFKDGEGKDFQRLIKIGEDIVAKYIGVSSAMRSLGGAYFMQTRTKDYQYYIGHIAQYWMALGLLKTSDKTEELEDVANQYMKVLWSRGFLEDFLDYGFCIAFKMHDLAISMIKGESAFINFGSQNVDAKSHHFSHGDTELCGQEFLQLIIDNSRSV
ncbi:putative disease resistance protein RGA4 [Pistacia vera]|uniref:putative disease resistance protein RGA4 n=1 Tax=Pistacia vera TaxID=55513 RepID=UPI001262AF4E|nr:putative disease resistance protein RGA4 [Pistacia vera]